MRQAFSRAEAARPDTADAAPKGRGGDHRVAVGVGGNRRRRAGRGAPYLTLALLLTATAGCADLSSGLFGNGSAASQAAPAPPPPPSDPLVAFAAQAQPGTEGTVVDPATGQAMRARLVRAYAAASGRECREVALLGTGSAARAGRLICRGEGQAWAEARPLLRAGTARP